MREFSTIASILHGPNRGLWPRVLSIVIIAATLAVSAHAGDSQRPQALQQRTRLSTSEISRRASSSVVRITAGGGFGSGVVLDATGVLVTNLEVLRGQAQVSITVSNGDVYDDVTVVDIDERRDLVLLKIKAFNLTPATIGDSEQVQVGEKVVLIGSAQGLDLTVNQGVISASRDSGEGYQLFQTSAAASPGTSGGGMFNQYGELIGIVSFKLPGGRNRNFALPVNYVRGLLSRSRMTLAELAVQVPESATDDAPQALVGTTSSSAADTAESAHVANVATMSALLEGSGLRYEKITEQSWSITYEGNSPDSPGSPDSPDSPDSLDNLDTVDVHVSIHNDHGDLALVRSVVAVVDNVANDTEPTPEQMTEMLRINFDADLAKVSLDGDGDITALNETELRLLDVQGLTRIVDAVAAAADEVATLLSDASGVTNDFSTESKGELLAAPTEAGSLSTLNLLQNRMAVRYDSSEWNMQASSEPGVHQLQHSTGDLYVRAIEERIQMPLEAMPEVALANAREVDPNVTAIRQGSRVVNGVGMLFIEYEATVGGVPFVFVAHFFSDTSGTVQIIAWTGRNLLAEYRDTIERFVSGFEVSRGRRRSRPIFAR